MRDGPHGLEVLLTVRPGHLSFMGGASVFPGGAVAAPDLDPRWRKLSSVTAQEAAEALALDDPADALGAYVCALREAFEEVGYPPADAPIGRATAEDAASFLEACVTAGVKLRTDELVPAGRWVTPLGAPVRFDARFFLTVVPDGWEPSPDPSEVEACDWIAPGAALAAMGSGERLMAPPTIEMLQRLDRYASAGEAIEGFRERGLKGAGNVLSLQVSPLVRVVLAPNAGAMTGPGTNTYIVGSGPHFVIDPAVSDDAYIEAVMEACAGDVEAVLVTHRHPDHLGGVQRMVSLTGATVRAFGTSPAGIDDVSPLTDGELLEVSGVALSVLHTPGHASDHLCLYMEGAASLFAGDTILGEGTAVIAPPDGDMRAYMHTLERLSAMHIDRIFPGHWRPLDGGREVIQTYITHRKQREEQIFQAVDASGVDIDRIVEVAYRDTPLHLHPIARFSALAHLEMLEDEGRVLRSDDLWRRVPPE